MPESVFERPKEGDENQLSREVSAPRYNFDEVINSEDIICSIAHIGDRPAFIHVGGVSASGKTTISSYIQKRIEGSHVMTVDDYFKDRLWDLSLQFNHVSPDPNRPYIGGLDPKIWDLDLLEQHIQSLRVNQPVSQPLFDQTRKERVGHRSIDRPTAVILEGGHAFSERFRHYADYKIYVRAPFHDCLVRKIVRTAVCYQRDDIDDVVVRYFEKDEPARIAYAAEHEMIANQIVNNPADPSMEFMGLLDHGIEPRAYNYRLTPMSRFGTTHAKETLSIDIQDKAYLQYAIGNRALVYAALSEQSVSYLEQAYEFIAD